MKKYILGIKIDDINIDQATEIVEGWLSKSGKHYIVTPNPEFIVMAQSDPQFTKILKTSDLSIPDGIGLKIFGGVKNRVAGVDLMEKLVSLSAAPLRVGLLGGKEGVAKKAASLLRKKYPKLIVKYAISGPVIPAFAGIQKTGGAWIPDQVRDDKVDILFVAFGQGKQEKWIANNLEKIPVKVAMGVGGAFDYLSGETPRAPKLIRDLGLEWLFRLTLQPWRIKRQLSLVKFIWLMLK